MASPVTAADFDIQNFSGDVCERLRKLMEMANTLKAWFSHVYDVDGNFTNEFLAGFSSVATPIGGVLWYPKNQVPAGYLICNGQAVSRITYAVLFLTIGTQYGSGDGTTTFNLPDLQRRYLIGTDGSLTVGQTLGNETVSMASGNLPYHTHKGIAYYRGTASAGAITDPVDPSGLGSAMYHSGDGGAHKNQTTQRWHKAGVLTSQMDNLSDGDSEPSPITILPPSMAGLWLIKH